MKIINFLAALSILSSTCSAMQSPPPKDFLRKRARSEENIYSQEPSQSPFDTGTFDRSSIYEDDEESVVSENEIAEEHKKIISFWHSHSDQEKYYAWQDLHPENQAIITKYYPHASENYGEQDTDSCSSDVSIIVSDSSANDADSDTESEDSDFDPNDERYIKLFEIWDNTKDQSLYFTNLCPTLQRVIQEYECYKAKHNIK